MDFTISKHTYSNTDVPLFYYSVKNFSPATVLNINDILETIPENNQKFNVYEKISPKVSASGEYILPQRFRFLASGTLIMTDVATESKLVDYSIPLFYQYQLMYDHYSQETTYPEGFITLRKNHESVVSPTTYLVQNRDNAVASGRYNYNEEGPWNWSSKPISGNVITARLLLPSRQVDDNYYTVEYNRYKGITESQHWSELVDERRLYEEGRDYTITGSSVIIPPWSRAASGDPIYIQKDFNSYVRINYPEATIDKYKTKEWDFSVRVGNFSVPSGMLETGKIKYYTRNDLTTYVPTVDEQPEIVGSNIVRVKHYPLIGGSSNQPNYYFGDVFEKMQINGEDHRDNIISIDTGRGFAMLRKEVNATDNVVATYNSSNSDVIVVRNVQLNPALGNSGVIDVAISGGIGLAIVPSGTVFNDFDGNPWASMSNLVMYHLNENTYGDFTGGTTNGWAVSAFPFQMWGGVPVYPEAWASGVIPSGSRFVGSISVNVTPEENLDLVDVRRTGGFDETQLVRDVSGWRGYSDVGYWNGESLPMGNLIVIQIPSGVYDNIYEVFESDETLQASPLRNTEEYAKLIDKKANDTYSTSQMVSQATNKYIKDTIERYLPAGTQYVVVDEDMNMWDTTRLNV